MSLDARQLTRLYAGLSTGLAGLGVESEPALVAELLWLAALERGRGEAPAPTEGEGDGGATTPAVTRPSGDRADTGASGTTPPATGERPRPDAQRPADEAHPPPARPSAPTTRIRVAPTLPALPPLLRALRPLRGRRDGAPGEGIDERATVRRITEEGLWEPVRRRARVPAWGATIVLDTAPTMGLWRGRVGEVTRLLRQLGAFAGIRWYHLDPADASLRRGPPPGVRTGLPPDPSPLQGAQVTLVLTDGLDARWRDGRAARALQRLTRGGALTLLHLLPAALWGRTRLAAERTPVTLRAGRILRPEPLPWEDTAPEALSGLLVDLDAPSLRAWSRRVVRRNGAWRGGAVLELEPPPAALRGAGALTGEDRARRFLASTSPTGRRLAALLSLAPEVDLSLARAVRAAALPGAGFAEEVEVLLGGILDVVAGDGAGGGAGGGGRDGAETRLRMVPEAREALLPELRGADVPRLYEALARWLVATAGAPPHLAQLLLDPDPTAELQLDADDPLIRELIRGMRAAGGAWSEVAEGVAPSFTEADAAGWQRRWAEWVYDDGTGKLPARPPPGLTARQGRAVRRLFPDAPSLASGSSTVDLAPLQLAAVVAAPRPGDDARRAALVVDLTERILAGGADALASDPAPAVLLADAWWPGAADHVGTSGYTPWVEQAQEVLDLLGPVAERAGPAVQRAFERLRDGLRPVGGASPAAEGGRLRFRTAIGVGEFPVELIPALEDAVHAAGHRFTTQDEPGPPDVWVRLGALPEGVTQPEWGDAPLVPFPGTGAGDPADSELADILRAAEHPTFTLADRARVVVDVAEMEALPAVREGEERLRRALEAVLDPRRPVPRKVREAPYSQRAPETESVAEAPGVDPASGAAVVGEVEASPALGTLLGWAVADAFGPGRRTSLGPQLAALHPAFRAAGARALPWLGVAWDHRLEAEDAAGCTAVAGAAGVAGDQWEYAAWLAARRTAALVPDGTALSDARLGILAAAGMPSDEELRAYAESENDAERALLYVVVARGGTTAPGELLARATSTERRLLRAAPRERDESIRRLEETMEAVDPPTELVAGTIALEWLADDVGRRALAGMLGKARRSWGQVVPSLAGAARIHVAEAVGDDPLASAWVEPVDSALAHLAAAGFQGSPELVAAWAVEPVALAAIVDRTPHAPFALQALGRLAWPRPGEGPTARGDVALGTVAVRALSRVEQEEGFEYARALTALLEASASVIPRIPALRGEIERAVQRFGASVPESASTGNPPALLRPAGTRIQLGSLAERIADKGHGDVVYLLPLATRREPTCLVFTPRSVVIGRLPLGGDAAIEAALPLAEARRVRVGRGSLQLGSAGRETPYDADLHRHPELLERAIVARVEALAGPEETVAAT